MKIFGHPVHLMLVHFPAALFPFDAVCSIICFTSGDLSFATVSFIALVGGVITGGAAIITGAVDLLTVMNENSQALKKALIHCCINITVVMAYSILGFVAYQKYPQLTGDSATIITFKCSLVVAMMVSNYLGGSLILKDKIAVEK